MSAAVNPAFIAKVREIRQALDRLDYFQILRLAYDAGDPLIRDAYRRQAHMFHPDRYHHLDDTVLSTDLTAIAKRVTEAYVVLRDPHRRARYLQAVQGANREGSLRVLGDADAQAPVTELPATTQQGRQLFQAASEHWALGERERALRSLQLALVYEPANSVFATTLKKWSARDA